MPGEDAGKAFRQDEAQRLPEADDQGDRRRVGALVPDDRLALSGEVKIEPGEAGKGDPLPGPIRQGGKGQARRQHEGLLRPGDHHVHSPGVHGQVHHAKTGDGVHHQQGLGPADDAGQGLDVVDRSRGGLAVGGEDGLAHGRPL